MQVALLLILLVSAGGQNAAPRRTIVRPRSRRAISKAASVGTKIVRPTIERDVEAKLPTLSTSCRMQKKRRQEDINGQQHAYHARGRIMAAWA